MSECFAAHIYIGGQVPKTLVPGLIEAICSEGLRSEDWSSPVGEMSSEKDLLSYVDRNGYLHFTDPERNWGHFDDLEAFLEKNGIAFNRSAEPKFEYSGELVQFRTGMKNPVTSVCDDQENILVETYKVKAIRDSLESALKTAKVVQEAGTILQMLNDLCADADITELQKFELVE